MPVFRIFVEKKPGYDVGARSLLREFKHVFGIEALTGLRIINRYDAEGLDDAYIGEAVRTVFSEPQLDNTYGTLPDDADYTIAVEYLPGQFDQRADSCAQCLQMLSCGERPAVRSALIYLLYGELTDDDLGLIRRHLINPVESMQASMELPETLETQHPVPAAIPVLNVFLVLDKGDLPDFCARYGFAMDAEDLAFCQSYFKAEGRNPTLTELRVIDTYWSDHCRHTTFLTHLKSIEVNDEFVKQSYDRFLQRRNMLGREVRPVTLMEIATIGARALEKTGQLLTLDKSDEVNACSVKIKVDEDGQMQDWILSFKNETHNHPTEIEPFGGAATCIGGAIRDPLSGRSYVYQAMRITGSGDPVVPVSQTLPGKLPQRSITVKAARGYSSYGNQVGLATGFVKEIYHPGYIAKRMEVGAVIGAAPERNIVRKKPKPGDKVILLGGRTGRDGCGGATGSSKSHNTQSLAECGAEVQKGNAPEERKIQRLFRNSNVTRIIKRCNDFGAGGVAVAVGELADGLEIDLDAVPKKYSGLDGTELAISESQERMAVVVSADDAQAFISAAGDENLEATVIATVTEAPRLVMKQGGKAIVDISREFLATNGTVKYTTVLVPQFPGLSGSHSHVPKSSLEDFFILLVSDLNTCSQKGLVEYFDSTIGAGTVLFPFGGKYQMTPAQAMAARLPVLDADTKTCSVMTYAFYPYASQANPYAAAYLAVASSVAKAVATGGSLARCWLSFQEYFHRLGTDPARWGQPFSALLGALDAQLDLGVAAIGGKDSMSGSFEDLDVPPTLISFAVSATQDDNIISGEFKKPGSDVVLMMPRYREDGVPQGSGLKEIYSDVERLISEKKVLSAYVIEAGGIGEAIFKMSIGNRIGFIFNDSFTDASILTGHYIGSIILELASPVAAQLSKGIPAGILLGKTMADFHIAMGESSVNCKKLLKIYEQRLESVFPTRTDAEAETAAPAKGTGAGATDGEAITAYSYKEIIGIRPPAVIAKKPRVLIPVFPGSNCEYDMERAFTAGGAKTEILVIKNLSPADIQWSVQTLSKAIRRCQILALPGGFSGGDEPEGSAKFIVSFFRNPRIKDAVHSLINNKDGLICGICNGFQALIKLGLVPYGRIVDTDENSATLTFNSIGRHQSMLVRTRIASNKSPWLADSSPGDIYSVAVSHGEGRFIAHQLLIDSLARNGQIATQYVDLDGNPTMDTRYNPNGSVCAIEGITSPDGRVFGKMGHNERMLPGLYKNVPVENTASGNIFVSAVRYFTV